jgi:hypothetical protein
VTKVGILAVMKRLSPIKSIEKGKFGGIWMGKANAAVGQRPTNTIEDVGCSIKAHTRWPMASSVVRITAGDDGRLALIPLLMSSSAVRITAGDDVLLALIGSTHVLIESRLALIRSVLVLRDRN